MTTLEKMRVISKAIKKLEDRLIILKYCEYDGIKTREEREQEMDTLQLHIRDGLMALRILSEQDEEAA